jgi:D-alanyl-D-alanine dipeptidase
MSAFCSHLPRRCFGFLFLAVVLSVPGSRTHLSAQTAAALEPGPKPHDIPGRWKRYIGEYGAEQPSAPMSFVHIFAEKDGEFEALVRVTTADGIRYNTEGKFRVSGSSPEVHGFSMEHNQPEMHSGDEVFPKTTPDFDARAQVVIHPVRPVAELRSEALASSPPHEEGNFRKPELVELAPLDSAIHLDIRYATTNDFLGTAVYTQARAFMQRPAAEALVRALHKLEPLGYGLLIHDAYRPWYVTKIFWDATPPEGKIFVADPSQGSRHNRGCAVDLTLSDLATGKPIEMAGTYDEMSPRSFPDYPGGTSLQRWHRDLLRRAMESEGFTVYKHEWWHFDYKDWHEYPVLNIKFEDLGASQGLATTH